jgi:hypothetical protein
MGHSIACGCIQQRLSIRSPHIISAALLLGAHRKSSNRPIGGINVGQKIVID